MLSSFLSSLICTLACCLLTAPHILAAENTAKDLQAQVAAMAKELESKKVEDVKNFLSMYMLPDEAKKISDDMVQSFMRRKQERLRKVLAHVAPKEPKGLEDGETYTFAIDQEEVDAPRNTMTFIFNSDTKRFHLHSR